MNCIVSLLILCENPGPFIIAAEHYNNDKPGFEFIPVNEHEHYPMTIPILTRCDQWDRLCLECGYRRGQHRAGDLLCPARRLDGKMRAERWRHRTRGRRKTWFKEAA